MPTLHAKITCSFNGASKVETERTITIDQEAKERFFPYIPSGEGRGFPRAYQDEMIRLTCALLRDTVFPDEITPVETLADLGRMGVSYLHIDFTFDGKDQLSMSLIG